MEGLTEALLCNGKQLKGRNCRVEIASPRQEEREGRTLAGNWRDNHKVVESAPAFGKRADEAQGERPGRAPAVAAPPGNWRDTAKPVVAETASPTMRPTFSRDTEKPSGPPKRPELKLLPRSKPVEPNEKKLATEEYEKSSKPNPFGSAKPREVVLSEKQSDGNQ